MDNNVLDGKTIVVDEERQAIVGELMRNVYLWMTGGIGLTGAVAWYVSQSQELLQMVFGNSLVMGGLFIVELVMVVVLSAAINKIRFGVAALMFAVYCALNGVMFTSVFVVYELGSVVDIFFITAGMFAALAFVGTVTKKDLSGMGTFLIMALFGLIIFSVITMIMGRPESIWVTIIAILIFAGLTVYDAQKVRLTMLNTETVNEGSMKLALLGALTLYLDFINLFIRLLWLLGKRK